MFQGGLHVSPGFFRERNPVSCEEVIQLAETYMKAHGGSLIQSKRFSTNTAKTDSDKDRSTANKQAMRCFKCQELGHISTGCPNKTNLKGVSKTVASPYTRRCFLCEHPGHIAKDCKTFTKPTQN